MVATIDDQTARPTAKKEGVTTFAILVRDREDFAGQSKAYNLKHHLSEDHITHVKRGTLWVVRLPETDEFEARQTFEKILTTNIFYNSHAQEVLWF